MQHPVWRSEIRIKLRRSDEFRRAQMSTEFRTRNDQSEGDRDSGTVCFSTSRRPAIETQSMKTAKRLAIAVLFLFPRVVIGADSDESKTVQNKEKSVQITLPKGWEIADFPKGTSKSSQERYIVAKFPEGDNVVVMPEPKNDFRYRTLKDFAEASMAIMMKDPRFEDKLLSDLRTVKVNSAEALQAGMHGTFEKTRCVFVNTFFDSPTRWTQIEVSTEQSRLNKVQDQIDAINKSFKELSK